MDKSIDKSIKKGLEFGVGMAYMAMETLNKSLDKLDKDGKISKKDSQKLVRDTIRQYQATGSKYAKQMQSELDELAKANPAMKKDVAKLQAKIKMINKIVKKYVK